MTRARRAGVLLALTAVLAAIVVVIIWWHPFGWKGVEQAGWIAGTASGVLSVVSTIAAVVALRSPAPAERREITAPHGHYPRQIQLFSPAKLVDRDEELAQLAAFCTNTGPAYAWWQGPAWAGKSALMAWFALHPPPKLRVIAFFITARHARQNDRVGFTDVVLEQLAETLGQPMPSFLTDSTRDAHFRGMLANATDACRGLGETLVLLVDGLDEDQMPTMHSIAALLPPDPPEGLRVVVAGRADRPLPADVPDSHPLRDPATVRRLKPSPYATVVRQDAERELKSQLSGTPAEQEQLAFLTVSGGGLAAADLAALTGRSVWEIEDRLRTSSGRTFTCRPARWQQTAVYTLGHEELQRDAVRYLGPTKLAGFRGRLHAWAAKYRDRGWPADTPEYLLSNYFWMASSRGDPVALALATDSARHDLMLRVSGGDALALAEIAAAASVNDIVTVARLAAHRVHLTERGKSLPRELPALWARLGNIPRAEALARSIVASGRRAWALSAIAGVLAKTGDPRASAALAEEAEAVVRSFIEPQQEAGAVTAVVEALASAGLHDRAEKLARTVIAPDWRAQALASVARARAAPDVVGMPGPAHRADAARQLAARLLAEAVADAETVTEPDFRSWALAAVAGAAASVGDHDYAAEIAERAAAVRPAPDPIVEPWALGHVAIALVTAGELDRAEELAHQVAHPLYRSRALIAVAEAVAARGDRRRATALTDLAENVAESVTDWNDRAAALAAVAGALPTDRAAALIDRLEALAVADPGWEAEALITVADAIAKTADTARAAALAERAESFTRAVGLEYLNACTLAPLIEPLHAAGNSEVADRVAAASEDAARSIVNPNWQAHALITLAEALADAGEHDRAEALARSVADPAWQGRILAIVPAVQSATAGAAPDSAGMDGSSAGGPGPNISDSGSSGRGGPGLDGEEDLAVRLAGKAATEARDGDAAKARDIARSIGDPAWQARALADIAHVQGAEDLADEAETVALTIDDLAEQAVTLGVIAQMSHPARAERLVLRALRIGHWHTCTKALASSNPTALVALAETVLAVAVKAPE